MKKNNLFTDLLTLFFPRPLQETNNIFFLGLRGICIQKALRVGLTIIPENNSGEMIIDYN